MIKHKKTKYITSLIYFIKGFQNSSDSQDKTSQKKTYQTESPCIINIGDGSYATNYIKHLTPRQTQYFSLMRKKGKKTFYTFVHPLTRLQLNYAITPQPNISLGAYEWTLVSTHPGNSKLFLFNYIKVLPVPNPLHDYYSDKT